jgi:hypothetical protein
MGTYLKNNKRKRAGGMAQVVELLPSKCEALSSNPSTTEKKKKGNIYIYIYICAYI